MRVGLIGSGIAGSLTALVLRRRGAKVTVFTASRPDGQDGCSYAAGGMLSPVAEALYGSMQVARVGWDSVQRWERLAETLPKPLFMGSRGSLVAAKIQYRGEISEWEKRLQQKFPGGPWSIVGDDELGMLEPYIMGHSMSVLHLSNEGFIDNRQALVALAAALLDEGVALRYGERVDGVFAGRVKSRENFYDFDLVVDCRGLGARKDLAELRGVRGEAILVHAPEVQLNHPVRVLHPRYPIYIVPRGRGLYYVGATVIESPCESGITVQSLSELVAGLQQFHHGFRYAHVLETLAQVRPAFDDHEPRIIFEPGLLRVNGFFRHGFLLGPQVAQAVADLIYGAPVESSVEAWIEYPGSVAFQVDKGRCCAKDIDSN